MDDTLTTLTDEEIVTQPRLKRRKALKTIAAAVVGAASVVVGTQASADPKFADVDKHTDVVNPDGQPDQDRTPPPSDIKDSDTDQTADSKDSDVSQFPDAKTHTDSPDTDGSLRDPKDSDTDRVADNKDSD